MYLNFLLSESILTFPCQCFFDAFARKSLFLVKDNFFYERKSQIYFVLQHQHIIDQFKKEINIKSISIFFIYVLQRIILIPLFIYTGNILQKFYYSYFNSK